MIYFQFGDILGEEVFSVERQGGSEILAESFWL